MEDKRKALENIGGIRTCLGLIEEKDNYEGSLIEDALDLLYELECEVRRLIE